MQTNTSGAPAVIRENAAATLFDIGAEVLSLQWRTEGGTFDADALEMLSAAVDETERGRWKGLVIAGAATDFCAGTNLAALAAAIGTDALVRRVQSTMTSLRGCAKPVVAAASGRVLGIGVELCMAVSRVVAMADVQMGFDEVPNGRIPAAGGCKEMVRRVISPLVRRVPSADVLPFVNSVLQTVASAKISSSAEEARAIGFLTDADRIVANREDLLETAKEEVSKLADGYTTPPRDANCWAAGRDVRAGALAGIHQMKEGAYISEEAARLRGLLAHVLCGGVLSSGQWAGEQYFLDLEREAFVRLLDGQR